MSKLTVCVGRGTVISENEYHPCKLTFRSNPQHGMIFAVVNLQISRSYAKQCAVLKECTLYFKFFCLFWFCLLFVVFCFVFVCVCVCVCVCVFFFFLVLLLLLFFNSLVSKSTLYIAPGKLLKYLSNGPIEI